MEMPHSRMFSAITRPPEPVFFDFIVQLRPHTRETVDNGSSPVTLQPSGQPSGQSTKQPSGRSTKQSSGQTKTSAPTGHSDTIKRSEESGLTGQSDTSGPSEESGHSDTSKQSDASGITNTSDTSGQSGQSGQSEKSHEKRMEKRLEKTSQKTGREIAHVLRLRAAQWEDLGLWSEYVNRMILDVIFLNSGLFFLVMDELRSASIRNNLVIDNPLEIRAILSKNLDNIIKNQVYETLMEYVRSPELTIQTFFSLYITRVLEAVQPEEMAKFLTHYLHVIPVPTALKMSIATGS